jgi:hypothetical protein
VKEWARKCGLIYLGNGKRPPFRVAFSYIRRLEDMQAAVNKAYIKNNIVEMANGHLRIRRARLPLHQRDLPRQNVPVNGLWIGLWVSAGSAQSKEPA